MSDDVISPELPTPEPVALTVDQRGTPVVVPAELTHAEKLAKKQEEMRARKLPKGFGSPKGVLPKNFHILQEKCKEKVRGSMGTREGVVYKRKRDVAERFIFDTRKLSLNEKGQTRFIAMLENIVKIACNPKHPQAVAAFNAVCDRAIGRPRPSEEEADAIAKGGLVVQISYPTMEAGVPIREVRELKAPEPNFIEAEFTEVEK